MMMLENYSFITNNKNQERYEKITTTPIVTYYKDSGEQKIEIPLKYYGEKEHTINLCLNIKICEEEKPKGVTITIVKEGGQQ